MEKIVDFSGIKVVVEWQDSLKPGADVIIHTGDPGLAINIIQLFLDEKGMHQLWYEQGWEASDHHQFITLSKASNEDWKNWSREMVLSTINLQSYIKP
jgi:hypothetical protein